MLKEKLFEQRKIYDAIKNGDTNDVKYKEIHDKVWGTRDENYTNRMRLAYYILYAHIEDEDITKYLFKEELKDRKSNSFQGIGNTLNVLTFILNKYNESGKYDDMFEDAKNANFDCACGYDKNYEIDDNIDSMDLLDCSYLSMDLVYTDVMEVLVNKWKETITLWNDSNRTTLARFNSFLGKEKDNETIYKTLLENAIKTKKNFDIVSAYNTVIRYYIDNNEYEIAHSYLYRMISNTDFSEIEEIRLFKSVLEECFEVVCAANAYFELWEWSKPYLQKEKNMYGDLYTKSIACAKVVGDTYEVQLKEEYMDWKKKVGLR